jgi:hypothetical protein
MLKWDTFLVLAEAPKTSIMPRYPNILKQVPSHLRCLCFYRPTRASTSPLPGYNGAERLFYLRVPGVGDFLSPASPSLPAFSQIQEGTLRKPCGDPDSYLLELGELNTGDYTHLQSRRNWTEQTKRTVGAVMVAALNL